PLAVVAERDNRGRRAHAFGVFDDFRRRPFHDRDTRIGGAQVDTDDLTHESVLSFLAGRPGLGSARKGSIADSPPDRPSPAPLILIPPRGKGGDRGSYKDHDVARKPSAHESASATAERPCMREAPYHLG